MNGELVPNQVGELMMRNSCIKGRTRLVEGIHLYKEIRRVNKDTLGPKRWNNQVSKLMIQKALTKFFSQNSVKIQESRPMVLERITPIGKPLSENKVKDAWNKNKRIFILGQARPERGYSVICINSTSLPEEINITNLVSNKLSKPKKLTCEPKTITKIKSTIVKRFSEQ